MAEQTSRLAIIIDSTGAEKNASSLSSALHGLTEWGQKAAASAGKVTKATQEEKSALQDLLDRIDPVNAALNKLDKQQQELSRAKSKGLLDADSFEDYAAKIEDARNRVSGLTGENEKLQASFSQIRSQLDPLGAALERLKSQRATLSAARDAGFLSPEYHAELSNRLNDTERSLTSVNNEMKFGSISASQYKNAMRMLPMQINDIATSIAGGMPLFTIFMQQGSQIADSFGGWTSLIDIIKQQVLGLGSASEDAGDSLSDTANGLSENAENAQRLTGLLTPTRLAIGGVTAVLGTLAYAWYKGSQEQDNFNESLILTGNIAGKTSGQLADIAKSVASSTGNTISSAAEALNRAVSGGKIASASLEKVTEAVVSMNDATGAAVDDLVNDFEKIAQNPVAAISDLNNRYHFLTLATYEQIKALQDEGNQQEAARVATDSYSAAIKQRSGEIKENLGTLQTAWNAVADAAKWAWDSMLDIGREVSIDQKILDASSELERAQKSLSDLQKGAANSAGPYGAWKSDDIDRQQKSVTILKNRLSSLRSEKIAQDVLNDSFNSYIQRQQEGIKLQQETSSFQSKYLTRQQQMAKELEELNKLKARGAQLDYAALEAQIRDRFKEPENKKGKSYTEDAGTRMLDQLRQQQQVLLSQADTGDKIGTQAQALIKWEQQLADIKSKQTLTADQRSLLANADIITAQLQQNAAIERQIQSREKLLALEKARADIARTIDNRQSQYGAEEFMASGGLSQYEQQQYTQRLSLEQSYNDKITQLRQSRASATSDIAREEIDQEIELQRQALDTELRNYDEHISRMNAARGSFSAGANRAWQEYVDSAANVSGMSQQLFTNAFSGMEDALVSFVVHGKASFRDFATSIISDLARIAARQALVGLGSSIFGSLFSAGASAATSASAGQSFAVPSFRPNAKGGVYDSPSLSSYSNGIYNSPQFFAFAKGAGVFGEAGPEAIMPLARGSNGSLGVRAIGASSSAPAINIGDINVEFNGEGQAADTSTQNTVAAAKQLQGIVLKTVTDWAKKEMSPGGVLYRQA